MLNIKEPGTLGCLPSMSVMPLALATQALVNTEPLLECTFLSDARAATTLPVNNGVSP